jgi:hypothetical protein
MTAYLACEIGMSFPRFRTLLDWRKFECIAVRSTIAAPQALITCAAWQIIEEFLTNLTFLLTFPLPENAEGI